MKMVKKGLFLFMMMPLTLNSSAQYFLTDTAKLNSAYRQLIKHHEIKENEQDFFDAFPGRWREYINLYDYHDADRYDLTMYHLCPDHVKALRNEMIFIPDSVYCKKIVGLAIGAQLDADAPNYLQELIHHTLTTRTNAMLDYVSSLKTGTQFQFWEFYWASIHQGKVHDAEFDNIYNTYKSRYSETMDIMADAHKYFFGGVDFASEGICPADDSTRCCCTNIAANGDATTYYKISTIIAVILILILTFVLLWQKKKLFQIIRMHRKKDADRQKFELKGRFISENEKELKTLKAIINEEKDDEKKAQLELRQLILANTIQVSKLKSEEKTIAHKMLKKSAIYKRITETEQMTDNDWKELDREVNFLFPKFREHIHEVCRISDHEYQVDLLLKTGITIGKISTLTYCSASSVSKCRQRQYQRAFGSKGKPEDWDTFIYCI